jgi:hypothetical protein
MKSENTTYLDDNNRTKTVIRLPVGGMVLWKNEGTCNYESGFPAVIGGSSDITAIQKK